MIIEHMTSPRIRLSIKQMQTDDHLLVYCDNHKNVDAISGRNFKAWILPYQRDVWFVFRIMYPHGCNNNAD